MIYCAHMDIWASVVLLWLMRPVAIAGVSGGFASLALSLLREAVLEGGGPDFSTCPICPPLEVFGGSRTIDPYSLLVGLLLGLAVGPVIDVLFYLRQIWAVRFRRLFVGPTNRSSFRVLE